MNARNILATLAVGLALSSSSAMAHVRVVRRVVVPVPHRVIVPAPVVRSVVTPVVRVVPVVPVVRVTAPGVVVSAPRLVVRPSAVSVVVPARRAAIDFDVDPEESRIIVDGKDRGEADDFDGLPKDLRLAAGPHTITIQTPDGRSVTRQVNLVAGTSSTVNLDLQR